MRGLLELSGEELLTWLAAQGQPPLRARQLRRWVLAGRAESFEQMTDLPLALRRALAAEFTPLGLPPRGRRRHPQAAAAAARRPAHRVRPHPGE
jgi:23S rRNA (adenine2503-C2)-methyltransferase